VARSLVRFGINHVPAALFASATHRPYSTNHALAVHSGNRFMRYGCGVRFFKTLRCSPSNTLFRASRRIHWTQLIHIGVESTHRYKSISFCCRR